MQNKTQLAKRRATINEIHPKPSRSRTPIVCSSGMTIIFVTTEVEPWATTGGLGVVLGGLPPALAVSIIYLIYFNTQLLTNVKARLCSSNQLYSVISSQILR